MEIDDLSKEVEAVLFAAGRKVSIEELKGLCKEEDVDKLKEAVSKVKQKLDDEQSPLLLTEEVEGYKLTVREKFLPLVQQIMPETELGRSILETLAVIAWKQPVLQSEVVNIRTSNAYEHISELVDLGFITKNPQGRSYIIKTTQKFAEYFDVPDQEKIKEVFKEAEEKYGQPVKIPAEGEETEEGLHLGKLEVYSGEGQEMPSEEVPEVKEDTEEEVSDAEEEVEKEVEEAKEEEEGEHEQMTEEMFEEAEEAPAEESALEALENVEEGKEEAEEVPEVKAEELPAPEEAEEPKKEEEKDKDDEGSRELPDELEGMLKTEQSDILQPQESREEIQEEVEEYKEIQEEEKELEEEEKEEAQEDIEVPEAKPQEEQ